MLTWSVDPTVAVETISAVTPTVTNIVITLSDALVTPVGYSISSTDFPAAIPPNVVAAQAGVTVGGTLTDPWDYLSIDYLDWNEVKHTVFALQDLPGTAVRKNLLKLEYDPTASIDYHITISCEYELVASPGSSLFEVTTFFWTLENDFTANRNTMGTLMLEESLGV